ncbi:LysR substrate-binding domain-containing protein [Cellulophaga baltica]|uniref:Transcriptional regulator n=1 Tax=Cellulophaga baltica 18 TaxID=1348584 RepID=A0AAU8RQ64_9FLAO|nr:LysR substrate-binding domain-containing protein [Cellulophaga baltica]AIZ42256.1 transcriptional regulator [Cellulophaga baltica 18]
MISKTNQLEFRLLRYFLVLAENLHYTQSAELLFISQSALSQQIKQLEAILGRQLFKRTNRKVELTTAGTLFVTQAKQILKQVDDALAHWHSQLAGEEGQLTIGFVGSAMYRYLPPIIKKYSALHPKINLKLEELINKEQLRALENDTLDVGFMRSNSVTSNMQLKLVYRENFSLVLPEDHAIDTSNFKNIGALSEESFILFPNENSPLYYQQILNLCAEYGFSPKISHKSIHGPTIFKLVENKMGIAIVPNSLRDDFNYKIKFIELTNVSHTTSLFAVWKKANENAALHQFLEQL